MFTTLSSFYNIPSNVVSYLWSSVPYGNKTGKTRIRTSPYKKADLKESKGILYAFITHKNTYKVGKTINLQQRQRSYKTIYPDGVMFHTIDCNNIHHSERILHDMLKMGGYHIKQEIFEVSPDVLKQYMETVRGLDQVIKSGNTEVNMRKIAQFINKVN